MSRHALPDLPICNVNLLLTDYMQQEVGLNDMDKISYLDFHARYLDIDTIRYDYVFGENQAFLRKIKRS